MNTQTWDQRKIFKFITAAGFLGAFAFLFYPFFAEILLAGVFAFAMEPAIGRWLRPRHLRWKPSVALILTAMFLVLAVPITVVGYKIYGYFGEIAKVGFQSTELFQRLVVVKDAVLNWFNKLMATMGLGERFDLSGISEEGLSRIANIVVQLSTAIVYRIPSALLALFIFCAALYFFLAEARMLRQVFERQGLLSKEETRSLIHVLQRCCFSTVVTSVLIAVIQATIVGVGAIFTKAGDFTVVWLMTFFASFIPVIGAGPVALFLALYKAVLNDFGQAIVLVIIAVIAGTSDNLLRPYLIATGEADLHPIVSLLAIIGALLIFGMPGLFLGPVIAMVAMKIVPTLYHTPREVTIEDSDPEKTKTLTTPKTR